MANTLFTVRTHVQAKNSLGQFMSKLDAATRLAMLEAAAEGAEISRDLAPEGPPQPWKRQVKLKDSIWVDASYGSGAAWGSIAPHGKAIEKGASDHPIVGNPYLKFYASGIGRQITVRSVNHPGNAPQPYLRPAAAIISKRMAEFIRRYM